MEKKKNKDKNKTKNEKRNEEQNEKKEKPIDDNLKFKIADLKGWRPPLWAAVFFSIITLFIGAFPDWYPIIKDFRSKPLVANLGYIWFPEDEYAKTHMIYFSDGQIARKKIDFFAYLRLTNSSSEPLQISDYLLEVKATDTDWFPIERLYSGDAEHFYVESVSGTSPKLIYRYLDFSDNRLDSEAYSKVINPADTVKGWSFFHCNCQPPARAGFRKDVKYRLRIHDTKGREFIVDLVSRPSMDWPQIKVSAENPLVENNCQTDSP